MPQADVDNPLLRAAPLSLGSPRRERLRMPQTLALLADSARSLAPLLRPTPNSSSSTRPHTMTRLMTFEHSWAENERAPSAEGTPRSLSPFPRSPSIPQEVRCSCPFH